MKFNYCGYTYDVKAVKCNTEACATNDAMLSLAIVLMCAERDNKQSDCDTLAGDCRDAWMEILDNLKECGYFGKNEIDFSENNVLRG